MNGIRTGLKKYVVRELKAWPCALVRSGSPGPSDCICDQDCISSGSTMTGNCCSCSSSPATPASSSQLELKLALDTCSALPPPTMSNQKIGAPQSTSIVTTWGALAAAAHRELAPCWDVHLRNKLPFGSPPPPKVVNLDSAFMGFPCCKTAQRAEWFHWAGNQESWVSPAWTIATAYDSEQDAHPLPWRATFLLWACEFLKGKTVHRKEDFTFQKIVDTQWEIWLNRWPVSKTSLSIYEYLSVYLWVCLSGQPSMYHLYSFLDFARVEDMYRHPYNKIVKYTWKFGWGMYKLETWWDMWVKWPNSVHVIEL